MEGWRTSLVSGQSHSSESHHSLSNAQICWREGGGDSCPLRRGRERGSLFSFGHSDIWIVSRESQTITLLLLQMVFSPGRSHKIKLLKLGRVILVVSIPSSFIISSNWLHLWTEISSRLRRCSSGGSNFFIFGHTLMSIFLRQEKVLGGTRADAALSFLNSPRKLSKHWSRKISRVWRESVA